MKRLLFCQKGVMTVQFLFGFILVAGFMAVFAALTLTLVVSEVVQYMTFSASRSLFLGHVSKEEQRQAAKDKYLKLRNEDLNFFSGSSSWFVLEPQALSNSSGLGLNTGYQLPDNSEPNLFYGVWVTKFQSKLLALDVMFLGSTAESDPAVAFTAKLGSYLGREPTQAECDEFTKKRWRMIWEKQFNELRQDINIGSNTDNYSLHGEADNGC